MEWVDNNNLITMIIWCALLLLSVTSLPIAEQRGERMTIIYKWALGCPLTASYKIGLSQCGRSHDVDKGISQLSISVETAR